MSSSRTVRSVEQASSTRQTVATGAEQTEAAVQQLPSSQANRVLKGHPGILKNGKAVGVVESLLQKGMDENLIREIIEVNKSVGIPRVLGWLQNLQELETNGIRGIKVVLSDLAQGGNKAWGAQFMLRYIEDTKLWNAVERFEALSESGGRRWDAIINGTLYQFKNWGEFRSGIFVQQISEDLRETGLQELKWIFSRRVGEKETIVKLATKALNKAAADNPGFRSGAETIIKNLEAIIETH